MLKALAAGAPACLTVTLARRPGARALRLPPLDELPERRGAGHGARDHATRPRRRRRSTRSSSTSCRGGSASVRAAFGAASCKRDARASPAARRGVGQAAHGPAEGRRGGLRAAGVGGRAAAAAHAAARRSPTRGSPRASRCRRTSRAGGAAGGAASVLAALLARPAGRGARRPGPSPTSGCCSTGGSRRCAASCRTARPRRRTCCWCATWPRPRTSRGSRSSRARPSSRARAASSCSTLTALGDYEEVDRFFQRLALSHRLVDVESLTLTATGEDQIQLATVAALPVLAGARPAAAAARVARAAGRAASRGRRSTPTCATSRWRSPSRTRSPRGGARAATRGSSSRSCRPSCASGRWCWATRRSARSSRSAAWRSARGPLRAFESRLERGFLRVSEFLMAKQGACHRFEARGRSPVAGPDAELPVPVEDPFEQDAAAVPRGPRRRARARGERPHRRPPKDPGTGPLTLRLRDVDLADVFQVLRDAGRGRLRRRRRRRRAA